MVVFMFLELSNRISRTFRTLLNFSPYTFPSANILFWTCIVVILE